MKLTDLRGILQYIPRFREKTFIISIDGVIVTSENFANILLDIAVLRSLSIKVVLVHGAGLQIEQAKKMKDLQKENAQLKRALATLTLEKQVLKDIAEGNF